MNNHKRILIFLLLALIILSGLKYRFRSYDSVPPISETFDEHVLIWVGSSLINNHIPVGWSFIEDYNSNSEKGYKVDIKDWSIALDNKKPTLETFHNFPIPLSKKQQMTLDGYTTNFTMVQPQIEQPPLGPVMASFFSGSFKKSTFDQVTLRQMRPPVILLSIFSMILIYLIASLSYGSRVGLLSVLIYALMPTIVVTSRLVTSENYLTPFILLGVFFTQLWIKFNKARFLFLASFLIIVCYLIKPFGIALAPVIFLSVLVFNKDRRYFLWPVISSALGVILFYAYGSFYSIDLFQKVAAYQTNRLFSPLNGLLKISLPKITKVFLDGWVIFSWIGIGVLAFDNFKKHFWVLAPVFSYLLMITAYGGQDYGWYRLPIYPYLSIAAAFLLIESIRSDKFWIGTVFLITAFASSLHWAFLGLGWNTVVLPFRLFIIVTFLLLILGGFNAKFKIVSAAALIFLLIITFWLSIQTINNMPVIWPTLSDKV